MLRVHTSPGRWRACCVAIQALFLLCFVSACATVVKKPDDSAATQAPAPAKTETKPTLDPIQAALARIKEAAGGALVYEGLGDPNAIILQAPEEEGPINIGILLPLSGPHAELGQSLLDAALMAVSDVDEETIRLLPGDTQGTPEGAAAAADRLLLQGAQLLLGPVFRTSVQAVGPIAQERGVHVICFSTDRHIAGNGVFVFGFTPDQQVERIVGYAVRNGYTRFAGLIPNNAYGDTVLRAFEQAIYETGAELHAIERYNDQTNDAAEAVKRLGNYDERKEALEERLAELEEDETEEAVLEREELELLDTLGDVEFDAILLPTGGQSLFSIAPLLPYYDIDPLKVKVLGTGLWDDLGLGREPALSGGWFAAPARETGEGFRQRYQQIFARPAIRIASLAYDATRLAAVLAAEADFSASTLAAESGFSGTDGIFRFATDGVAQRGLAVIEVQTLGTQVIDPAPAAFDTEIY